MELENDFLGSFEASAMPTLNARGTISLKTAPEQDLICNKAQMCLDQFLELLTVIHDVQHAMLSDQLGRFRIWSSSIGVFAAGHASLDHRLRDAPDVRRLILHLLETVLGRFQNCQSHLVCFAELLEALCSCSSCL